MKLKEKSPKVILKSPNLDTYAHDRTIRSGAELGKRNSSGLLEAHLVSIRVNGGTYIQLAKTSLLRHLRKIRALIVILKI